MDENKSPVFPVVNEKSTETLISTNLEGRKSTYISIKIKDEDGNITSILEFDLMSFREKGEEKRFLSANSFGFNPENNEAARAIVNIDNKDDFDKLKNFFEQLEWND